MRDRNSYHSSFDETDEVAPVMASDVISMRQRAALSALADGECDEDEWTNWSATWAADASATADIWHRYHLIGDVMRMPHDIIARDADTQGTVRFAQGVMAQLSTLDKPEFNAGTQASDAPPVSPAKPTLSPLPKQPAFPAGEPSSAPAANDPRFDWRRMGMLASLMVVGLWASSRFLPVALAPEQTPLHPLQAQRSPQASIATPVQADTRTLIETTQGTVIRDTRLELWMQTHRQHGGGSAFQVPTGFLRAATSEPASTTGQKP